jgi:predicted  nucleic acid-binding Zn-ribbon protein
MDKEETNQLDDIHDEVKGSHAQLGAINERTRNIEDQLDKIADDVSENESDINDLEDATKRNTTILTGVTGGSSMILLWLSDKVTRIL